MTPQGDPKSIKNGHKTTSDPQDCHLVSPREPQVTKMDPKATKITPRGPPNGGFGAKNLTQRTVPNLYYANIDVWKR